MLIFLLSLGTEEIAGNMAMLDQVLAEECTTGYRKCCTLLWSLRCLKYSSLHHRAKKMVDNNVKVSTYDVKLFSWENQFSKFSTLYFECLSYELSLSCELNPVREFTQSQTGQQRSAARPSSLLESIVV